MDVVTRPNVKMVQFADDEWAVPEWQWPYLPDDVSDLTHEEWVKKHVNARLLRSYIDQAVPYKRGL